MHALDYGVAAAAKKHVRTKSLVSALDKWEENVHVQNFIFFFVQQLKIALERRCKYMDGNKSKKGHGLDI